MQTNTTSIQINARPSDVFAFLADGEKLAVWAIGFAKAAERDGRRRKRVHVQHVPDPGGSRRALRRAGR